MKIANFTSQPITARSVFPLFTIFKICNAISDSASNCKNNKSNTIQQQSDIDRLNTNSVGKWQWWCMVFKCNCTWLLCTGVSSYSKPVQIHIRGDKLCAAQAAGEKLVKAAVEETTESDCVNGSIHSMAIAKQRLWPESDSQSNGATWNAYDHLQCFRKPKVFGCLLWLYVLT